MFYFDLVFCAIQLFSGATGIRDAYLTNNGISQLADGFEQIKPWIMVCRIK